VTGDPKPAPLTSNRSDGHAVESASSTTAPNKITTLRYSPTNKIKEGCRHDLKTAGTSIAVIFYLHRAILSKIGSALIVPGTSPPLEDDHGSRNTGRGPNVSAANLIKLGPPVVWLHRAIISPNLEILRTTTTTSTIGMMKDGGVTAGQLSVCLSEGLSAMRNQLSVCLSEGLSAMRNQPSEVMNKDNISTTDLPTINMSDLLRSMTPAKFTRTITTDNETFIETGLPPSTKGIVVELHSERNAYNIMILLFVVTSPASVGAPSLRMNVIGLPSAPGIPNVILIDANYTMNSVHVSSLIAP
jgi:hypothetical protein